MSEWVPASAGGRHAAGCPGDHDEYEPCLVRPHEDTYISDQAYDAQPEAYGMAELVAAACHDMDTEPVAGVRGERGYGEFMIRENGRRFRVTVAETDTQADGRFPRCERCDGYAYQHDDYYCGGPAQTGGTDA